MDILPAIDLKDGKAVRLSKGLMDSAKIYSDEPWQVAKRFEELGSKWLHIVDLNGAFAGTPENLEQIKKIRENGNALLELINKSKIHFLRFPIHVRQKITKKTSANIVRRFKSRALFGSEGGKVI